MAKIRQLRVPLGTGKGFALKSEAVAALGEDIYAAYLVIGRDRFLETADKNVGFLITDFRAALRS